MLRLTFALLLLACCAAAEAGPLRVCDAATGVCRLELAAAPLGSCGPDCKCAAGECGRPNCPSRKTLVQRSAGQIQLCAYQENCPDRECPVPLPGAPPATGDKPQVEAFDAERMSPLVYASVGGRLLLCDPGTGVPYHQCGLASETADCTCAPCECDPCACGAGGYGHHAEHHGDEPRYGLGYGLVNGDRMFYGPGSGVPFMRRGPARRTIMAAPRVVVRGARGTCRAVGRVVTGNGPIARAWRSRRCCR